MKRRGVLGLLLGGAAAGPSMAKQAVASLGIDAMALPAIPSLEFDGPIGGYGLETASTGLEEYDHGAWLKERIAEIAGISDAEKRERIAEMHVSTLDPDLATNRSFSLAFKVQEQKRRNFERMQRREHSHLLRDLANHLKSRT